MLDPRFDINIFPKRSWEETGKPKLVYSPIKLWVAKKYKVFPIGRLENVEQTLMV